MSSIASLPSRIAASLTYSTKDDAANDQDEIYSNGTHKIIQRFREQIERGQLTTLDYSHLVAIVDALRHPNGVDDRKMLLEHVLVFLARLPAGPASSKIQDQVVKLLYNDLPHPAATYIGTQYAWRTADGSNNNCNLPDMGKAGTPYSRSVQQSHPLPRHELPDPGLIYDTLLRRDKFVKHPAGLSSLMFSFAALVIHTVFRTSHTDVNINETSSYVDLSPLYGNDQASQDKVRMRNGRGLLHPDTFAENRLLLLPPAVCVLLVLFNRNHNYIARKLLEINERATWVDPESIPSDDPGRSVKLLKQEEEIFQTARLVNCAWFASVVFSDYFSAILGLVRDGSSWSLQPFGEIRNKDNSIYERGRGNVCSVEFNCLYRWHATTSVEDDKWSQAIFAKVFDGKTPDEVTMTDFRQAAGKIQAMDPDVTHWTIGNMNRQADQTFNDSELASVLKNATKSPAGAFKARGAPPSFRLHEIMGIEQNRTWGVCSLNDFRKFLGLKTYSSFLEWNPDPEIATAAEKLYGNIEYLELYVGLMAEESKELVDGAGLCPSYTTSRAILADAIALTRGDRFYTADYTPFNMTAWGFADCQRDANGPGFGSMLGRLLLRTLPSHYTADSTYTWFPLMTPEAMKPILTKLDKLDAYSLNRPDMSHPVREVSEYRDVAQILGNSDVFTVGHSSRAAKIFKGEGFFIASDNPKRAENERRAVLAALIGSQGSEANIADYFYDKTRELMLLESYTMVASRTRNVDIVRDVLKFLPIHWASEVAGIRLKSKVGADDGDFTTQELFNMLSAIYSFLFLDIEPSKLAQLEHNVRAYSTDLLRHIKSSYSYGNGLSIAGIVEAFSSIFSGAKKTSEVTERLLALGLPADTLAHSILAFMVGATVEMSQSLIHVVNFYLDENQSTDIHALASKSDLQPKDKATLEALVKEALRLDPPFRGVYREAVGPAVVGKSTLNKHEIVFVDIASASRDPEVFRNPTAVNPGHSPKTKYLVGDGSVKCLGDALATKIMSQVVRGVYSFPKLRRAPSQSGKLKRFEVREGSMKTSRYAYLFQSKELTPWATSMVVQFE